MSDLGALLAQVANMSLAKGCLLEDSRVRVEENYEVTWQREGVKP